MTQVGPVIQTQPGPASSGSSVPPYTTSFIWRLPNPNLVKRMPGVQLAYSGPSIIPKQVAGLDVFSGFDELRVFKYPADYLKVTPHSELQEPRYFYKILDSRLNEKFDVKEKSNTCCRRLCRPDRGFQFHIRTVDSQPKKVMSIERDYKFLAGNLSLCLDHCYQYPIIVKDGKGKTIGTTRSSTSCCSAEVDVFDVDRKRLYVIKGPGRNCYPSCCEGDQTCIYSITRSSDEAQIGSISRVREDSSCCSQVDHFTLTIPKEMDVKEKSLLLGAVFQVDFAVFEKMQGYCTRICPWSSLWTTFRARRLMNLSTLVSYYLY